MLLLTSFSQNVKFCNDTAKKKKSNASSALCHVVFVVSGNTAF